jgi:1,2-dihydroxy-3-keto-5-methylthiopentene dioxygenase
VRATRLDGKDTNSRTEHWFALGPDPGLKALRLFSREKQWVADYTGRQADPALLGLLQAGTDNH